MPQLPTESTPLTRANPSKDGGAKLRDYSLYYASRSRPGRSGCQRQLPRQPFFVFEPVLTGGFAMKENYGVIWI